MKRRMAQNSLDNLKKGSGRPFTKEDASEYGRRGQAASVIARKKNKDLATITESVADSRIKEENIIQTLEDLGVKEIPAQGEKFNPNFHEAVMRGHNPEMEDETIDMVFEKGYQLHDKVVRHSKVRVISSE